MTTNGKRTLLGITYYSLILFMITLIVFFILGLRSYRVYTWAEVCYIILSVLLLLLVIYDVICNVRGNMKFSAGMVLIVLTYITAILSFVLFGVMATRGTIPFEMTDIFIMQVAFSYAINITTIIIYCIGTKWANNNSNTITR